VLGATEDLSTIPGVKEEDLVIIPKRKTLNRTKKADLQELCDVCRIAYGDFDTRSVLIEKLTNFDVNKTN
jgi:hypothetical protein